VKQSRDLHDSLEVINARDRETRVISYDDGSVRTARFEEGGEFKEEVNLHRHLPPTRGKAQLHEKLKLRTNRFIRIEIGRE